MTNGDALQQARTLLSELLEAARTGAIIPVRLPGQIEAIAALLDQAEEEQAAAAANAMPADVDAILKDQAQFMSHAVHELRTPVTSVRGYSDMLNTPGMGELTDMQKQFVDVIRTNAKRMESLLADVSYINKLRSGNLRMNIKMDMAKNIIMMVDKKSRPIATELKRELEIVEVPQGLPLLNTDGEMLSHALVKIIENGLRYSPEETGKVTISTVGENNNLYITVEDNGVGMTPEEIDQLGTLYFRSDNDVVRGYKGSGLGIPIAYGIIDLLGGAVSVESEPEKGSRFVVSLPGMS